MPGQGVLGIPGQAGEEVQGEVVGHIGIDVQKGEGASELLAHGQDALREVIHSAPVAEVAQGHHGPTFWHEVPLMEVQGEHDGHRTFASVSIIVSKSK